MRQSRSSGGTRDAGGVAGEGPRGQRPRAAGRSGSRRRAPRARGGGAPARGSRTDHSAVCKLARSLFFSLARASLASTLTSRGGSLPARVGLTSDPACREVFQLEAAHGRSRGGSRCRSRVGAQSESAARSPRPAGRGRKWETRARLTSSREPRVPAAPQASLRAHLAQRPRQPLARPQRTLKAPRRSGTLARRRVRSARPAAIAHAGPPHTLHAPRRRRQPCLFTLPPGFCK